MSCVAEIVARVESECAGFSTVRRVGDFAALLERRIPIVTPGAYVLLVRRAPTLVTGDARPRQSVEEFYSVVIATRHADDAAGAMTSDRNDELVDALDKALLGWTPRAGYRELSIGPGQLLLLAPDLMLWDAGFSTRTQKRVC